VSIHPPAWLRPRVATLAILAALALLGAPAAQAETPTTKEFEVKAAFLFNFTQFVEWPASAFPTADAPIRIGILGDDPFGAALDETVHGESVQNRRLMVVRAIRMEDLQDCQLVYISRSEKARLADILAATAGKAMLTVSDLDGFSAQGGVIRFYLVGKKVRFEINPEAAQQHGLRVNAQLLSLGKPARSGAAGGGG
jgi:hypothetical protein